MGRIVIPENLTLSDVQRALRSVQDLLDGIGLTNTGEIDLRGRRIVNAGIAEGVSDYVTRAELEQVQFDLTNRIAQIRSTTAGGGTTGTQFPDGPQPPKPDPTPVPSLGKPDIGYYLVDRPGGLPNGDLFEEQADYTNVYHSWFGRGHSGDTAEAGTSGWYANMTASLSRAFSRGKKIHLLLDINGSGNPWADALGNAANPQPIIDQALTLAQPYWSKVTAIEISDEGISDRATLNSVAATLRSRLAAFGLAMPPNGIGTILTQDQAINSDAADSSLDFIDIELYLKPIDLLGTREANIAELTGIFQTMWRRIPPDKKLIATVQAYGQRSSSTGFTQAHVRLLEQLQIDIYEQLIRPNTSRIFEMLWFSYGRATGTRELSNLFTESPRIIDTHRRISEKIFGGGTGLPPGQTCGGEGLPLSCARYCVGGQLQIQMERAMQHMIAAFPGLFDPLESNLTVLSGSEGTFVSEFINHLNDPVNGEGTSVQAALSIDQLGVIWVQRATNPSFYERYRLYDAGTRIVTMLPGSYLATCVPAAF